MGAFFKKDGEELLQSGEVWNANYHLVLSDNESYTYPVDGWWYFDTERDARTFFNLAPPVGGYKRLVSPREVPNAFVAVLGLNKGTEIWTGVRLSTMPLAVFWMSQYDTRRICES